MATAIQFLRSSTPNLRPNPVTLEDGMPMLNYDPADPGLYFALEDDSLLKVGPTHVSSTAPNSGAQGFAGYAKGEQWLDTSSGNVLKTWDGGNWLSASFALSGDSLINDGIGIRLNEASTDFATFPRNNSGDGYNLFGNVGFGTDNPTHKVTVGGGLRLLDQASYPTGSLGALATVAGSLVFHNGTTWQLVVTPSGVVGVESVNGQVGIVTLDADDIDDSATTHKFVSLSEKTLISTATQPGDNVSTLLNDAGYLDGTTGVEPGDNISTLTNDAGYITSATAPVQQLVAGTNVSLSPTNGLGTVTVNSETAILVSSTAPVTSTEGALWWDDTDGRSYIWYVDADSQQWVPFAPGVAESKVNDTKAWARYDGSNDNIQQLSGVENIVKNGTGDYTVTLDADLVFASANDFCPQVTSSQRSSTVESPAINGSGKASFDIKLYDGAGTAADSDFINITVFGLVAP